MVTAPHICVIGSVNIDFVTFAPRCPGPGETLTATSLVVTAGGKGANQAVACGRASFASKDKQDVTISMIGAVGADDPYYSTLLRPVLEESGVTTKDIEETKKSQTGSATIIVEEETAGENRILVVPGANHSGMGDITNILKIVEGYQNGPDVIVMQGEIPRATVLGLLQHFNNSASNIHVIFNPAPVFPEGLSLTALTGTAVLVMNETEALQMARSIADITIPAQTEVDLRPEELVRHFHNIAKVRMVIITLGAKGVFFSTITGKQGFVRGVKVPKVVDTTAAGDTFVGYFAIAFAKYVASGGDLEGFDLNIETAVKEANVAAAVCVTRRGAMQSIPFAYE
jgi:ribokinase